MTRVCRQTVLLLMTTAFFLMMAISFSSAETIVIGAENDWIPYAQADATGMANDIIRAAYKSVDIEVRFEVFPYKRILVMLERNQILGGFNVPLDKETQEKYLLGKTPLYDAVSAYYHNKKKPLHAKNRDGLNGKVKIGIVLGYGYGDHFLEAAAKGFIIKEETTSETMNIKKLAFGRIDGTILYDKTASLLIKQLNFEEIIEVAFPNETTPIYLAFSQYFPKSQYYADKLDEGLEKIKADGIYQKILDYY